MKLNDIFTFNEIQVMKKIIAMSIEDDLIFPNWEFSILIGINLDEAQSILDKWPDINFTEENVALMVNNILANLMGYPHGQDAYILSETGLNSDDILHLFNKFREKIY